MRILGKPYTDNSMALRFLCDRCGCAYEAGEDEMTVTMVQKCERPMPGGKIVKTVVRAEAQCPECKLRINSGMRTFEIVYPE